MKTITREPRRWAPALLEREGHIATTASETWAFFRLRPMFIDALTPHETDALIRDAADRVASLAAVGAGDVWLRVTAVPFPSAEYEQRLRTPLGDKVVEDAPGGMSRDEIVERAAWHPLDLSKGLDSRWPVAVVGVKIGDVRLERCDIARVLDDVAEPASRGAVAPVRERLNDVTQALALPGWEAEPITDAGFTWLYDASLALGHYMPQQRPGEPGPLDGARVTSWQSSDGTTMPVTVDRDGERETVHVRMLRLADWRERDTTVMPPWIAWAMTRPYRVDVAGRFTVRTPEQSVAAVRRAVRRNEGIRKHMQVFDKPLPDTLKRALRRGPDLLDEMESGSDAEGTQIEGQWVFAVAGDTEREAIDNAKRFKAQAAPGKGDEDGRGPGLILDAPPAQWAEGRKFLPCEKWPTMRGHIQHQSPLMVASGLANATSRAGDSTGAPWGPISGSGDFYLFDAFGGIRRNKAGVFGVVGDQGSGKSTVLSYLAWWLAIVEQVPVTIVDPSGKIADQLRVPELWPHTREIRLDPSGRPGILASHFLTPDPVRELFDTQDEYDDAVQVASTERIESAIDAALAAMSTPARAADPAVVSCIRSAVTKEVGGRYGVQPSEIIDAIARTGDIGPDVAAEISAYRSMSGGRLLWGDRVGPASDYDTASGGQALITIVSVAGVTSPRGSDPSTWTTAEARSVVLLAGAAKLAAAHIWQDTRPKAFLVDEATNLLVGTNAFHALVQRGALDSRKYACSFVLAMHLSDTLLRVGSQAKSLFGAAALLRTSRDNAVEALPMLGVRAGLGWEDVAETLGDGRMVMSGWDRRTVLTELDLSWLPDAFRMQLSTSPLEAADPLVSVFGAQS